MRRSSSHRLARPATEGGPGQSPFGGTIRRARLLRIGGSKVRAVSAATQVAGGESMVIGGHDRRVLRGGRGGGWGGGGGGGVVLPPAAGGGGPPPAPPPPNPPAT